MDFIEFEDLPSTNTPLDEDNLNHNFDKLKPYVLYSNSNGSTGNIELSDSASNYLYFKISYINEDGYSGTIIVSNPNNKKTTLTLNYYNQGINAFMHWAGEISISGTTITHTTDYYYENNQGTVNTPQTINYIKIYEVIGYK